MILSKGQVITVTIPLSTLNVYRQYGVSSLVIYVLSSSRSSFLNFRAFSCRKRKRERRVHFSHILSRYGAMLQCRREHTGSLEKNSNLFPSKILQENAGLHRPPKWIRFGLQHDIIPMLFKCSPFDGLLTK